MMKAGIRFAFANAISKCVGEKGGDEAARFPNSTQLDEYCKTICKGKKNEDPDFGALILFMMFASNFDAKLGCHYGAGLSAPGGMR
jgi:hypothetical protein